MAGCIFLALATSLCSYIPSSEEFSTYPGKRSKKKTSARRKQWKTLYREDVEAMGAPTDSESTSSTTTPADNSMTPRDFRIFKFRFWDGTDLTPNYKNIKKQFRGLKKMFEKATWEYGTTSDLTAFDLILEKHFDPNSIKGTVNYSDGIITRNFFYQGMAVFCTWTRPSTTNHIKVLVSTPSDPEYEKEIPDLISFDLNKLQKLPFTTFNIVPFHVLDVGKKITNGGYYHWQDRKINNGINKKQYMITVKPEYLKFTEEQPLETWIEHEDDESISHYCMVGATVFRFKQPTKGHLAFQEVIHYITNPRPFLKVLKKLNPKRYLEVLGQIREFDKDANKLAYWQYDISDQSVDQGCYRLRLLSQGVY
eukprot:GHVP01070754.1.p1 GENE.GHVP01070754.1~~GHVP01070754.1.p1  ORF type:complete len:366 (-),score=36.01 GHVP01070754.1:534-1631(-)